MHETPCMPLPLLPASDETILIYHRLVIDYGEARQAESQTTLEISYMFTKGFLYVDQVAHGDRHVPKPQPHRKEPHLPLETQA